MYVSDDIEMSKWLEIESWNFVGMNSLQSILICSYNEDIIDEEKSRLEDKLLSVLFLSRDRHSVALQKNVRFIFLLHSNNFKTSQYI